MEEDKIDWRCIFILNINTFVSRMNATSGNSIRGELIKNNRELISVSFPDDPSANPYITYWKTNESLICRITDRKKSSTYGVSSRIQVFHNTQLEIGDILYDSNEKIYWLCVELYNIDDVLKQGLLGLCTYIIKFQSSDGTILSYPIIDSTNSTLGLDENKTITTPNGLHTIKVPFDAYTNTLIEGRRIYLDRNTVNPRSYRITKVNNTEFAYGDKGLIEFTLQFSEKGEPDDRPDLGICNYKEPIVLPNLPDGENYATLNIDGELIMGGNSRIITAIFYNADGTINNNIIASWNVVFPVSYEDYFSIFYNGNTCSVKFKDDDTYMLLSKTVVFNVSDGNGDFTGSLVVEVESGW